jgi:primosomal protein N' (replication factor Y)
MMYVQLSGRYSDEPEEVKKTTLQKLANASSAQVRELERKGILEIYEKEVGRLDSFEGGGDLSLELSKAQEIALDQIHEAFSTRDVVLLHGVTSSGKTELYIELIREALEQGKQVLYMLPEIALTAQMIERLQRHFGDLVAVYHSRFNQNERVELWQMVLKNDAHRARVILGARSSIFLPFRDLGLIIVDEEHENSFKQYDPAPRYHARDAAIMLGNLHGARTILGSATPSLESMYNSRKGKFGYIRLTERYGGQELPEIRPVSLQGSKGYFTETLLEKIGEALSNKEQVILFQNRRGYAPILLCQVCGWSPECTRCDVTLTYHKAQDRFLCHYCGSRYSAPPACPACGSHKLRMAGFGTERIEEELPIYFPDAQIGRLDLDSTRSKNAYAKILNDFQDGLTDILIGTQMITKGLDFGRVSLVGILNADLLLRFPDFRATERAYQLMTQVAGRAGRRKKRGEVIIQTQDVSQWIIQRVIDGDFEAVLEREMEERREYRYPPFTRLIRFVLRHRQMEMVDYCAESYKTELLKFFDPTQILGPEYPPVARVKNQYNKHILVKILPSQNLVELKRAILKLNERFFEQKTFRSVRLVVNVDPQ